MTVKDLKALLDQLDDNDPIHAQVVDQKGGAWNVFPEFDAYNFGLVIRLSHPLPDSVDRDQKLS